MVHVLYRLDVPEKPKWFSTFKAAYIHRRFLIDEDPRLLESSRKSAYAIDEFVFEGGSKGLLIRALDGDLPEPTRQAIPPYFALVGGD